MAVRTRSRLRTGGSGERAEYLGAIATRGFAPERIHASHTMTMARTRHIARETVSSFRILVSAWAAVLLTGPSRVEEAATGADMSVTASVSTSTGGPWTQVLWSGVSTGTVPAGSDLESDDIALPLTAGDTFYVLLWKSCATGIVHNSGTGDVNNGDLLEIGTAVTDRTDGSAFAGNANNFTSGPTAILGLTQRPSILLVGDSITYGTGDLVLSNASGDIGKIARSIGQSLGYIVAARPSDMARDFALSNARRVALQRYTTHVIAGHGRNDVDTLRTSAQIQADITTIASLFSRPLWWDTISPRSSSTDSWATLGNQTVQTANSERGPVNTWLRAHPTFFAGVFDTCQAIENNPITNEGRWLASHTSDGQHPNQTGYAAILSSGVIDPDLFT